MVNRKSLIKVLTPIGNERQIDEYINSINQNIKDDYDYSRETYYDLLEKGKESLQLMIEVARESEHPRAFEVLSNMIKQTGDLTGELLDVQKKRKDIKNDELIKETCYKL